MSLGYALLHQNRIELSLRTEERNSLLDELSDAAFSILGVADDLGPGVEEYLNSRVRTLEGFFDQMKSWVEPSGPFGFLQNLLEGRLDGITDLPALLDRLIDLVGNGTSGIAQLRAWLSKILEGLPAATSLSLSAFLRGQFNDITAILEGPFHGGGRDLNAHRGFRSAVLLRQIFSPLVERVSAGGEMDLKTTLGKTLDDLLNRLKPADIQPLAEALRAFRDQYGGLLRALTKLNTNVTVNAAEDGLQGMPDAAEAVGWEQDALAAPHPIGHPLWIIDLVTGIFASFFATWEMVRAGNWKGREADGVFNVLGIAWQFTQTFMRTVFAEKINLPTPAEPDGGKRFVNWLFTDQGNLAINLLFRFLGSCHDMHAASNWALGFAGSTLKYYSNIVNSRVTYWYARACWYFHDWGKRANGAPASMVNTMWAIWGPATFIASFFGLFPAWEDFSLETGFTGRTIGVLISGVLVGQVVGYLILGNVAGVNPFSIAMAPDWPTFILFAVMLLLGVIVLSIILANLETDKSTLITVFFVLYAALLAIAGLIGLPILFATHDKGSGNFWVLHIGIIIIGGLFLASVLPFILWWFYVDDGRDKHGYFDQLNADTSPYRLPYRQGENWMCGQGVHGIFSHYIPSPGSSDNHFAYDFNERENRPALAARGGVIVNLERSIANGDGSNANFIEIQHDSWANGHDPGTDQERVLTSTTYYHLSKDHLWGDEGHRIVQGYHLADIDNTGRSACHHLHFHAYEKQTGSEKNIPSVFRDQSLRRFRNFPLLAWIPGGGHIDGKPISFAFYESDNTEQEAALNPVRIILTESGSPPHHHFVDLDRRTIGTGVLPATLTVFTSVEQNHVHQVTLDRESLVSLLGLHQPDSLNVTTADLHTHGFEEFMSGLPGRPGGRTIEVFNPPAGQLVAGLPGPYRLVGEQLVLRINDRATEYYLYGAHRPALGADVALDRGIAAGMSLRIGNNSYSLPAGTTDQTVRGTARRLNQQLRTGSGGAGLPVALRCLPVLTVETRRRGRTAALESDFRGETMRAAGSGAFDNLAQIAPADLAAQFNNAIRSGWPAAPAGLAANVVSGQLTLSLGSAAADVAASSARIATVLTALYDQPNRRLRAMGPLPLSTGRLVFGGATPYQVPLLAAAAQVRINTADPAFAEANLAAAPLEIEVLGVKQPVTLAAGESTPDKIARKIMDSVEGVRAWPDGAFVVVQTVTAGSSATLRVSKLPTGALGNASGSTPSLTAGGAPSPHSITDSTAVSLETLSAVIGDARQRATLPYSVASVNPQARMEAGKLVIEVAGGHTISLENAVFTGNAPFTLTQVNPARLESAPLPATLALDGPAWFDLLIDGHSVRIPMDGEGARCDLRVFDRLPVAGETLRLAVDGGAAQTVAFTGNEPDLAAVCAAIARVVPSIVVRMTWMLSIENTLYQAQAPSFTLSLPESGTTPSPALASAGFLRDRGTLTSAAIGVGSDQLNVAARLDSPIRHEGVPVEAFTLSEIPAGANLAWRLQTQEGFRLEHISRPANDSTDPLGLTTASPGSIQTRAVGPTVDLGVQCRQYDFVVKDSRDTRVARSSTQIAGAPAIARTLNAASLPLKITPPVLTITVTDPDATTRAYAMDLAGFTTLDEIAQRIDQTTPALRAWVARSPGIGTDLLHLETAGAGSGFSMKFDNAPLLAALGFDPLLIDWATATMTAKGHGTVANTRAVTPQELRAALQRAVDCATGLLVQSGGTVSQQIVQVGAEGANLALSSLEGAVTIETSPPGLRDLLKVAETPTKTTMAPGATFRAENGAIIVKVAGRTVAAAALWGDQATVRANQDLTGLSAIDETAMLTLLKNYPISLWVDGSATLLPLVPAGVMTLSDAVEFLAAQVPKVWIGLPGRRFVVESRDTGAAHSITLDFNAFRAGGDYPAFTILGFDQSQFVSAGNWSVSGTGRGSVQHMEALPTLSSGGSASSSGLFSSLEELLTHACQTGGAPQAVYNAEVAVSTATGRLLRLRTNNYGDTTASHVTVWTLKQAPPPSPNLGPGSIRFSAPDGRETGPILEAACPTAQAMEPGIFEMTATVDHVERPVWALLAAQPARLPEIKMPSSAAVLNGKGFDLTINGAKFSVTFTAPAGTTAANIAAQIERQCQWTVRARAAGDALTIESVDCGNSRNLILAGPSGALPNAVTDNITTGFTSDRALPLQETGAGAVGSLGAVTADEFKELLLHAYIAANPAADSSYRDTANCNWRAYEITQTASQSLKIRSGRDGCMSSVIPVIDFAPSLSLRRDLERAPAARAAVALPPLTGSKNLTGTLTFQFNDNPGLAGAPVAVNVPVTFPAGSYDAREVARRIHDELFGRGIGQAAAYPDGTVVIETRTPGLTGTVRVPAPGTGTSGADQSLLRELIGAASELFARGWPGVADRGAGMGLKPGFRSRPGPARTATKWKFEANTRGTSTIEISAGQGLTEIQRKVDEALAAVPAGRIGWCVLGPDETLYIEATGSALSLLVDGNPLAVKQPEKPGDTPERAEEPALGLRKTDEIRTLRFARDRIGRGRAEDVADAGWLRVPATSDGIPHSTLLAFPYGCYWIAVRPDAAKTRDYDATGDMVISGGQDPHSLDSHFVHRARYWVSFDGGQPLRIVKTSSGEFLLEVLWGG